MTRRCGRKQVLALDLTKGDTVAFRTVVTAPPKIPANAWRAHGELKVLLDQAEFAACMMVQLCFLRSLDARL